MNIALWVDLKMILQQKKRVIRWGDGGVNVYQIMYTLNSILCQLYLSKAGIKVWSCMSCGDFLSSPGDCFTHSSPCFFLRAFEPGLNHLVIPETVLCSDSVGACCACWTESGCVSVFGLIILPSLQSSLVIWWQGGNESFRCESLRASSVFQDFRFVTQISVYLMACSCSGR